MFFVTKSVEAIISTLKKDPEYCFKTTYTNRQIMHILYYRGLQIVRGILLRLKIKCSSGFIFSGRSVVIEHGYMVRTGPNLILEDNVHINALSENGVRFGRNVTICKGAIIICTGVIANRGTGVEIGDYSAVGAQSFLGGQGGIVMGKNVIMGPGVRIFSENHNYNNVDLPIRLQGETRIGVVIEDDCWIGAGTTILAGSNIGTGSVIAAGSVVTKTIPPYSVVAGVPAKNIKTRSLSDLSP